MENEKKTSTSAGITIAILLIIVVALCGYIGYDKFLRKDTANNTGTTTNSSSSPVAGSKDECVCDKTSDCSDNNSVSTRVCTGRYKGTMAVSKNIMNNSLENGEATITLKDDGTYEFNRVGTDLIYTGSYTIIDNALLLKSRPDLCPNNQDCSERYTQFLTISNDCSTISNGYGSLFFDPAFSLSNSLSK